MLETVLRLMCERWPSDNPRYMEERPWGMVCKLGAESCYYADKKYSRVIGKDIVACCKKTLYPIFKPKNDKKD